jgi:hypothetical protein
MFPTDDKIYVATVHRVSGNCRWTASPDTTAEIIGPASGTGDGVCAFHPVPGGVSGPLRFTTISLQWDGGATSFGYVQVSCRVLVGASVSFSAAGGTTNIGTSVWPACPILARTDADWLTTFMTAGGGIDIHATAAPNPFGIARTATVTVKTVFGDVQTVPVTQLGN